jgi:hypothetical protein
MASGDETLTRDVIFDVLSRARRRQVLQLLSSEGPMELTDLAERVAAVENDTTVEDLTKQQRKRVYVSLYQTHIPKMEEAGLVEYDTETKVVSLESRAVEVDRYLEEPDRFRWQVAYVAVAAAGLALIVLSNTTVPVVGGLSQSAIAIGLVVAMVLLAAAHFVAWTRYHPEFVRRFR